MLDPKKISEIVQEVVDALPPGLKNLPKEVRDNFNEALKLEPNYPLAYAGLVFCYHAVAYFGVKRSREVKQSIKKNLQRIFEIDENLSEAYDGLAFINALYDWKRNEAGANWHHCIELNPNNVGGLRCRWYTLRPLPMTRTCAPAPRMAGAG